MAGSFYLYLVAVRALGVHAFQVGIDGFIVLCHQVPAGLQFPSGIGNGRGEHFSRSEHLRVRHELGLFGRQVGGEVGREVGGIEEDEAVRCLDQRSGGVGELLTVGGLGLALFRCVRSDVYERGDMGISTSLGDNGSAVAVANQDALAWLAIKDTLGRGDIVLQRGQRVLYNGDAVTVFDRMS